ncbi:hypothetical protein ACFLU5_10830 [Bacteroidota bacterium]
MAFYLLFNSFVYSVIIIWLYNRTRQEPLRSWFFYTLFFKVGAGIILGLLYIYVFKSGDTISYHKAASWLSELARKDPGSYFNFVVLNRSIPDGFTYYLNQPRALFFTKLISLFAIITYNNYWLISIYFSLFSFIGTWLLANRISSLFPSYRVGALLGFLLFPSVVFWSSGLLKESIAMGCISLFVYIFLPFFRDLKINIVQGFILIVSALLLWLLKYYYAGILFSVTIALFISKIIISDPRFIFTKKKPVFGIYLFVFVILSVGVSFFHPNLNPLNIFTVLEQNHFQMAAISDPDNLVKFIDFSHGISYFLINIPVSLFGGLFLPLPWSTHNYLGTLAGSFNLVVLIIAIAKVFSYKKVENVDHKLLGTGMIVYIVILAILLTFSTPNYGTLERFKVSYLPFFLLFIVHNNPLLRKAFHSDVV